VIYITLRFGLERTIRIRDALNVRLRTKVEIEPDKQEMAVA
jgi:hypothetical protein